MVKTIITAIIGTVVGIGVVLGSAVTGMAMAEESNRPFGPMPLETEEIVMETENSSEDKKEDNINENIKDKYSKNEKDAAINNQNTDKMEETETSEDLNNNETVEELKKYLMASSSSDKNYNLEEALKQSSEWTSEEGIWKCKNKDGSEVKIQIDGKIVNILE